MFKLIRKIFIVYFLCITLTGLVMVFIDSKFSEKQPTQNSKSLIIKHTINPDLIMLASSIGGFLGVYAGTWLFDYGKDNFYLSWGSLMVLGYNIALILSIYSKTKSR
ncbi:hypothetical protein [Borrelia miyamotoi]|nr:hypothetical protein [Borrelia miyamotoi]AGT27403.1 hypothetical protein I871_02255 [Borrelia miyamotoi LB-2001]AJA58582.1 hypothetical protein RJ61_02080 [Borrelia miyamotoi]AOW95661.1 hypothetical protein AXH25_02090 [Borrelia miyamotoi]QTL83546.1 hypothetical protein bmLB2001_000415 [Borrelia miyamotoi]WAZ94804.1 hypothetical protein O5397_02155 [Borrelia miyamotoi]